MKILVQKKNKNFFPNKNRYKSSVSQIKIYKSKIFQRNLLIQISTQFFFWFTLLEQNKQRNKRKTTYWLLKLMEIQVVIFYLKTNRIRNSVYIS